MGASRRHWQWRCALARPRNLAAALERTEISAEGGRFHLPRHCRGPRARSRAHACGRRLAGRGFSAGCIRACRDRRPDRRPFHPRSPAVNILAGFADISLGQLVLVGGMALFASSIGDTGVGASAVGYGVLVGGTSGSGVILLSLLMASGLEGAAVIATDAVISVVTGLIKISVFGLAGVVTAQVLAFALLIGAIAIPGAFLAKTFVERMPVHIHTAILDAAVMVGGVVMITAALRR